MATTRIDPVKKTFNITASSEEYSAIILALVTFAGVLDFRVTAMLNSVMNDTHITKAGQATVRKIRKASNGEIPLLTACDLLVGKPKAVEIESTTEVVPDEPDKTGEPVAEPQPE